jgi:integrase/recombinase XerD
MLGCDILYFLFVNSGMQQVILKPLHHRNQECIGIYFDNTPKLNGAIRKFAGAKWSQANKVWYVPLNPESYNRVYKALKEKGALDVSELKSYLEKKKQVAATMPVLANKVISKSATSSPVWQLSKENLAALERYIEELKLRSYSSSSIRTYRNEFLQLLQLLKEKSVNELTPDDLRRYMVYAMEKQGMKIQHTAG